jgi:hypothetical protein
MIFFIRDVPVIFISKHVLCGVIAGKNINSIYEWILGKRQELMYNKVDTT